MARYLLTGAAGFIGAVVAQGLLQQGHEVVGLDNLNDAYDPRLKTWRLDALTPRAGFRFERADISDAQDLERAWGDRPYDAVLNLAARAGVRPSMRDPLAYARANLIGALNVLELCKRHGVAKVVQASTSSLYGAHNPRPFREDADISRPLSPYAASKGAAELLCHSYHHLFGLDVTILRGRQVVAEGKGHLEQLKAKSPNNAVVARPQESGPRQLTKIQFGGKTTVLVLAES